jgi:hypothetical protein
MALLAEASGFKVNWGCAPKDIGKLEVEKPKAKPQIQRREPERRAWVCFLASRSARAAC